MSRRLHRTATLLALVAVYLPIPSSLLAEVHPDFVLRQAAIVRQDISPSAKPQGYSLRWVPGSGDGRTARVEVSGLSLGALKALQNPRWNLAEWKRVLAIYTEPGNSAAGR